MDSPNSFPNSAPAPEPTPQVQVYISPSSPLKKILKVSAVFLGIIILVLTITLTLNYFNILHFSFLPHQSLSQVSTKGKVLHPEEPILMPTPNSSITLQQADSVIKKIAATIIKPELIPQTPTTANITPKNLGSSNITLSFASSWKDNKGLVFQINASFKKNSAILNSYDVVIGIPKGVIKTPDSSSATKFVTNYINPQIKPAFKCANTNKKIPEFTLCKASLEEINSVKPTLQVVYPL